MARVSFTLRQVVDGSFLRYDDDAIAPRPDYDSALRADGLQIAPAEFAEAFFEAYSSCYGEVDLRWAVNLAETLTIDPQPYQVLVVYSPFGEPQTIGGGTILVESATTFNYRQTDLPEGRWAYYSLFLRYRSTGGDDYYEKVASLTVMVPRNYQSNIMLWERIPEYYRREDASLGVPNFSPCIGNVPPGSSVGPLFKYLSVIGFEIDRIRSILDYVMVARDPSLAEGETLDALAEEVGIPLRSNDLGDIRLRRALEDIGYFRRAKGTKEGTTFFFKAVSGSDIEIDTSTGDITVFSQRVNYITNPRTATGIVDFRAVDESEITTPLPFSPDPNGSASTSLTYSSTTFALTGTPDPGIVGALIEVDSIIPVQLNDNVYFSVHSNVGTQSLQWARLVDSSGNVVGFSDEKRLVDGVVTFEIRAENAASPGIWTDTKLEVLADLRVAPLDFSLLLAERNNLGSYFDGSTVRGGWLVDTQSVSDYRWAGSANSSVSLYAEDYERTKKIVEQVLALIVPVTEEQRYQIVAYNAVPGM
jgi:hypothetical protein